MTTQNVITGLASVDPGFDPQSHLGKRGWRHLPSATQAALAGVRLVLDDASAVGIPPSRTGVVIGTNHAVAEIADRMDTALLRGGVSEISPLDCPHFSVNLPASQMSIAHGLGAFNMTLVDLATAGLEAVLQAAGAIRSGRADAVVTGAIEGPPPVAAQIEHPRGSAASLLHLETTDVAERRGARSYGRIVSGTRCVLPVDPGAALHLVQARIARFDPRATPIRFWLPDDEAHQQLAERIRELGPDVDIRLVTAHEANIAVIQYLVATLPYLPAAGLLLGMAGPQGQCVLLRITR